MPSDQRVPVEAVLGTSIVFAGLAYPVTAAALDLTSPALIAVARALAGGLIMLPVLRLAGARLPRGARGWAWAPLLGAGNITITLIAISEGTRLAGAAVASVLLNSAPFFVAVLARLFLDERLPHCGQLDWWPDSQASSSWSPVSRGVTAAPRLPRGRWSAWWARWPGPLPVSACVT